MKIYTQRLDEIASDQAFETVELSFDTRQKSRFRATLSNSTDIGADLPRTGILRSGSLLPPMRVRCCVLMLNLNN
jgi:urease accessory protein